MTTTDEVTYLGTENGWHVWSDGTRLPVLLGFDEPDADDEGDEQGGEGADDAESEDDEEEAEEPPAAKKKPAKHPEHASRQAARFRVERNQARQERDELRAQVAFLTAAGGQFIDSGAAWKLADKGLLTVGDDGSVEGAEDAVAAVAETNPFLLAPEPDGNPETNPFKSERSSGRKFNGKKKVAESSYNVAELERRFPALRRGR